MRVTSGKACPRQLVPGSLWDTHPFLLLSPRFRDHFIIFSVSFSIHRHSSFQKMEHDVASVGGLLPIITGPHLLGSVCFHTDTIPKSCEIPHDLCCCSQDCVAEAGAFSCLPCVYLLSAEIGCQGMTLNKNPYKGCLKRCLSWPPNPY